MERDGTGNDGLRSHPDGGSPPGGARTGARARWHRAGVRRAALALALPWLGVIAVATAALFWAAPDLIGSLRLQGHNGERFLTPLRERIARVEGSRGGEGLAGDGRGAGAGAAAAAGAEPRAVALFGDSISWGARTAVAERFAAGAPATELVPVTTAMLRPVHYVYLLDEVLRAEPALALVEVNVVWLGSPPVVDPRWQARLSRTLRAERAVRIAPALAGELASPFDPWLFRAEERAGLLFAPDGIRTAVSDALEAEGRRWNRALGLRTRPGKGREFPLDWVGAAYAADYVATPSTGVLREILRGFRDAGVPVVFFVPPINEAELAAIGMAAPADLGERIERLRIAVGAQRDEWLDLHALVPPDEFRDVLGHLGPAGEKRFAGALAEAAWSRLAAR